MALQIYDDMVLSFHIVDALMHLKHLLGLKILFMDRVVILLAVSDERLV